MSGGEAYILDEQGVFSSLCNTEMVALEPVESQEDIATLRRLLANHLRYTGSAPAERVLANWDDILPKFIKIMPHDYKRVLMERAAKAGQAT